MAVIVLVLLTMWLSLSPAFAGAGIPVKGYGYSSYLETGTAMLVKASPGLIYGMTVYATSNNALLTVYDTNASNETAQANIIYEVAAATSGNSESTSFGGGALATTTGIVVTVSNGYGFLNYQ